MARYVVSSVHGRLWLQGEGEAIMKIEYTEKEKFIAKKLGLTPARVRKRLTGREEKVKP